MAYAKKFRIFITFGRHKNLLNLKIKPLTYGARGSHAVPPNFTEKIGTLHKPITGLIRFPY
jgi:hypothetical protein